MKRGNSLQEILVTAKDCKDVGIHFVVVANEEQFVSCGELYKNTPKEFEEERK